MKPDSVFKRAFNRTVDILEGMDIEGRFPSENELRRQVGVSRTTVRKVLAELAYRKILDDEGAGRKLGRPVGPGDYYALSETTPRNKHIEQQFMEWMLRGDAMPGALINELELARSFGVATGGIREFLIRFSRFGLIEKRPNSGWLFKGLTQEFALELFEIRVMFELRSARLFAQMSSASPLWQKLDLLMQAHKTLFQEIETRFQDFSGLDNQFHRLINEASQNRFIDDFYDIISFIFHYHYQWNKNDERQRNQAAIVEHIAYIEALESRDLDRVEAACLKHLSSARATLTKSLLGQERPL